MSARLKDVCFDAHDVHKVGKFWANILGWVKHDTDPGRPVMIAPADSEDFRMWFNPVPEPKTVKNRVHVDVDMDERGVDALVAAGARIIRDPNDESPWWVLVDPEDNEFCAFAPQP
jgi:hypothetical protein